MKGISVIIPTYNREKFIKKAIESVIQQDFEGPIEILISDDGSTDATISIAESFGKEVTIIKKENNNKKCSASASRNRGIREASHPYICFLDSDDFFLPSHISKMVEKLESNPQYDFVFCRCLELDDTTPLHLYKAWTKKTISKLDVKHLIISDFNVVNTNSILFKKDIFRETGLFNEDLLNAEDIDLWMRVSERFNGVFSNHFGAVIRKHDQIQLTKAPKKYLLKTYFEVYKSALKRSNFLSPYKTYKLIYLILKYKICQLPVFHDIYNFTINYKNRKDKANSEWQPLTYYFK